MFENAPIIAQYTRQNAIDDGVLINVTETAAEAGFKLHTVVTQGIWTDYIALPENYKGMQDERGRLWDIIWMSSVAARARSNRDKDLVIVKMMHRRILNDGSDSKRVNEVSFWLHCGPGDSREPVLTIMRPEDY